MSCGRPHETPCTEVIAAMGAYIDGEVGAEEFRLIAIHITECSPCEREEQAYRRFQALVVRAVRRQVAPETLRAKVRANLTGGNTGDGEAPE